MSDNDLIRRGDAREILEDLGSLERSLERIAALPAVTVGVKPLVWVEDFADHPFGWYESIDCGDCIVLTQSGVSVGSFHDIDAAKAAAQADYEARILAALEPHPAQDAAAIREAALREAADALERECRGYSAAVVLALLTEKPCEVNWGEDVGAEVIAEGEAP